MHAPPRWGIRPRSFRAVAAEVKVEWRAVELQYRGSSRNERPAEHLASEGALSHEAGRLTLFPAPVIFQACRRARFEGVTAASRPVRKGRPVRFGAG
jgi:hypothetical protein